MDRGLPAIDGLDVIRRLRARGTVSPVLVLTARGTVPDRVDGLDAGAEDYLVKPFETDELLARLRALLRRHRERADVIRWATATFDVAARRVVTGTAIDIELSVRECALLSMFARHPRRIFTRDELLHSVFGDAGSPGTVDTYVHYLRRKLGHDAVRTVHAAGYQMGVL